jgi:hypothetical protein
MHKLRDRAEMIARIGCLLLALLLIGELVRMVLWINPFHGVKVPELPALTVASEHKPAESPKNVQMVTPVGTNIASATIQTNGKGAVTGTNALVSPPAAVAAAKDGTNLVARAGTGNANTNPPGAPGTNALASTGTNRAVAAAAAHSNSPPAASSAPGPAAGPPPPMIAGANFPPGSPRGRQAAALPPALQSRIDRIVESELLAPVMHPLPMALLGIAGDCAFLRSANGQTGLVKTGDSLDDLKLLQIGTNRVLVEQAGRKQELMIFAGYGGDSLMPKDSTNEINHP